MPLKDGITDGPYLELFRELVGAAVSRYNPSAIVMQCGAGSLAGDRVGTFNLTHVAHCVYCAVLLKPASQPANQPLLPRTPACLPGLLDHMLPALAAACTCHNSCGEGALFTCGVNSGGAVEFVCEKEVPLLLLGGGGYAHGLYR